MITFKNKQVSDEAITMLNELIEMDIKIKTAYKLSKIVKDIANIQLEKNKMEQRIFEKYVVKNEDGSYAEVLDENGQVREGAFKISEIEKFNEETIELLDVENTLNYEKINISDLGVEKINTKTMLSLDFIFTDEDTNEETL